MQTQSEKIKGLFILDINYSEGRERKGTGVTAVEPMKMNPFPLFSIPSHVHFLLPLLFPLFSLGLFSLLVSSIFTVSGRACKPFHPTMVLDSKGDASRESVLILTKVSSFYLLFSERLASSSGCPWNSVVFLGVL